MSDLKEMKITYHHMRVERNGQVIPRGTVCYIRDGVKTAVGIALCSDEDNFSYKLGRQIAFGRASHIYRHVTDAPEGETVEPIYALRPIASNHGRDIVRDIEDNHPSYEGNTFYYVPLYFKEFVVLDPEYKVTDVVSPG